MTGALLHYIELHPKPLVYVSSKGKKNTFDGAGWNIYDIWASNWNFTEQRDPPPVTWGTLNCFIGHFAAFQSNICDGGMLKKHK